MFTPTTTTTTPSPASFRRSRRTSPADVADPEAVHERHARSDPVDLRDRGSDVDHVAVLADQDALARDADLLREPRVMLQVSALAVHRDEPAAV